MGALGGCEPEPEPQLPDCVELSFDIDSCAPLYQPTFDNVWTSSLDGVCDTAGGSCHGKEDAAGAVNGLVLADPDGAHAALMGEVDGRPFVDVADPACSVLMVRLAVDDDGFRMPPGEFARTDAELCAIAKWMADGAER
jgi:hypothetical protein